MPSRMIDFDALWTSDKLRACKESMRAEYAWFYGLADGHGCFEINLASIHSRVSCIRPKLSIARIGAILAEFHRYGLLFIWNDGKCYGFWTGSERRGRLPPEAERKKYKRSSPAVPLEALREYVSRSRRDGIAITSPHGLVLDSVLDLKGTGLGSGEGAPEARGSGANKKPAAQPAALVSPEVQTATSPIRSEPNFPDRKSKLWHCEYCDENFPGPGEFQVHKCRATSDRGYRCIPCDRLFDTLAQLKSHRQKCPERVI